ncbi:unnamed protein product [Ceratitis capitata]|uniref:(Mediterranean fruit fly) hypothetical protein n=1 Tax=Ceratitis capitata TaxID=7213 RepID=A0A811UFZ3_CERCA|nr:unnamed protein product [Ceratitis capitata]
MNLSQTYKAFGGFKPSIVRALHFLNFYKSVEIFTYAALFAATEKKSAHMGLTIKLTLTAQEHELYRRWMQPSLECLNDSSQNLRNPSVRDFQILRLLNCCSVFQAKLPAINDAYVNGASSEV